MPSPVRPAPRPRPLDPEITSSPRRGGAPARIAWALAGLLALLPTGAPAQSRFGDAVDVVKLSATEGGFNTGGATDRPGANAVASLGDLDGDGNPDLAVGSSGDDDGGLDRGAVWILFLAADRSVLSKRKISATEGAFVGPLADRDGFGAAVASPGDFDGDGVPDLFVGAPGDRDAVPGQPEFRGAVWVLFLNPDGTVKAEQKISETQGGFDQPLASGDLFGAAVAALGDLDDDGIPDMAVGMPGGEDGGAFDQGAVWILLLNADATVRETRRVSDDSGQLAEALGEFEQFGTSLAPLGDLDGDGVEDLAVGAIGHAEGGVVRGAVWILFLAPDAVVPDPCGEVDQPPCEAMVVREHTLVDHLDGGLLETLDAGDIFGTSIANLGDVDGDGVVDLAIGASGDDDGAAAAGAFWVVRLDASGGVLGRAKVSATQGAFTGELTADDNFGAGLATLVPGDGADPPVLAVAAPFDDDGGGDRGAVWVVALAPADWPVGTDRDLVLGDKIKGTHTGQTVHAFTFEAVAGTELTVKVKGGGPGGVQPAFRITSPSGMDLLPPQASIQNEKKAGAKKWLLPETGTWRLEILDLGAGGDYKAKTKARWPKIDDRIVGVGLSGPQTVTFDAIEGSELKKVVVKRLAPKGAFATIDGLPADLLPGIDGLDEPDGDAVDLAGHVKTNGSGRKVQIKKAPLDELGSYELTIRGQSTSVGWAEVRTRIKAPKGKAKLLVP